MTCKDCGREFKKYALNKKERRTLCKKCQDEAAIRRDSVFDKEGVEKEYLSDEFNKAIEK